MLIKWANTRYTAGNHVNKWETIWPHSYDKVVSYITYNSITVSVTVLNMKLGFTIFFNY